MKKYWTHTYRGITVNQYGTRFRLYLYFDKGLPYDDDKWHFNFSVTFGIHNRKKCF